MILIKYIVENTSSSEIINQILLNELTSRGFVKQDNDYEREGLVVNLEKRGVKLQDRDSVVKIGDKGICNYTLNRVLRFNKITSMDEGKEFIKCLKECGIKISGEELFLLIDKMNREN